MSNPETARAELPWLLPDALCVTRDGTKARIYAVDGGGDYPVHGAQLCGGSWYPIKWTLSGNAPMSHNNSDDLLGPWIEPTPIPWDDLPRWAVAVACSHGGWQWFDTTPKFSAANNFWYPTHSGGLIPAPYAPPMVAPERFKDSLVLRPTA